MAGVLRAALARQPDATGGGPDPAAALHAQVTRCMDGPPPVPGRGRKVAGLPPAGDAAVDPELRDTLAEIERLSAQRVPALTEQLLRDRPG
jgi:hypothetical protein